MPRWFSDGMVLQTNAEYGARSFLNGIAKPGESVSITGDAGNYEVVADSNGEWVVMINPGAPHKQGTITVQGEDGEAVTASDVQSGDVFYCGGQSNMVFPMEKVLNAEEEIATLSKFPNFRFFMTGKDSSESPQWDFAANASCAWYMKGQCNQWITADAEYLSNFSAVCYLTARDISLMHIGQRPVGLIMSAWGGTRVEAWMSTESIAGTPYAGRVPEQAGHNAASVLYNAMVHPWRHFSVRAVIWYQGEANAGVAVDGVSISTYYSTMYQAMIADWRDRKGMGDFAWLTSSLAPKVGHSIDHSQDRGTMDIRLAQAEAETHPDCLTDISGTAVAMDLGGNSFWGVPPDKVDTLSFIHPPNKNELARRLALQAVHVAYAQQGRINSPIGDPPAGDGCLVEDRQYSSQNNGNANLEKSARQASSGGDCQQICASTTGCMCFTHNVGNGKCWLMTSCVTPTTASGIVSGAPVGRACPGTYDMTSTWTGPVLDTAERGSDGSSLLLRFQNFSALGMSLRDVKGINLDGSSNDCTLCCEAAPPFEVTIDGVSWTSVPRNETAMSGSVVELHTPLAVKATAVRYAYLDFVECVLQNSDGLPAGPFWRKVAAPAKPLEAKPASSKAIQSPPMGFNSWNFYHCNIDENTVKAVVDAIASNGMRDVGFEYVNIDDCWQVERYADGTIQPDPARFPSGMKAVADYAHEKGLKFGVYTARGSRTCQNRPGAYQHEEIDAATYCDWGLDYLKNDNCGGSNWDTLNTSWIKFTKGFDECYNRTGRHTVRSVETCESVTGCGEWIADSANLWRTTGDIQATWSSVISTIHANDKMAAIARPGHFNDPDMMQIGNVGLSIVEQYSHMTLWCVAGAPLLIGTDLVHPSAETLKILTNPEPIAINQDLGYHGAIQGRIVRTETSPHSEIWAKRLAGGASYGVVLLNLEETPANVTARWADLDGLSGPASVRDLWARLDLGSHDSEYTAEVQGHGTVFLKVVQQSVAFV